MRRWLIPTVVLGCLAAIALACYGDALLRGRQFGYRDSAHFYYPLYQRVQDEWKAGRWPLWEPEENGGMPLLGNPTAAVLYPGKVIYALLPYPWAARIYIVFHSLLAFAGMHLLLRSWGTSPVGSALGALGYAFGMPVLFQYCNIIFLIGAAWLPLGFRAADRWLRLGRRFGLVELAAVLALQTLGGDPESAYVLGVCAAGYAMALAWRRAVPPGQRPAKGPSWRGFAVWFSGLFVFWVVATLLLGLWLPDLRPPRSDPSRPMLALPWMRWVPPAVASVWGLAGVWLFNRWRRSGWRTPLGIMLSGLLGAAALGAALSAAQLLPVLEFTGQSGRAAGQGPHDVFPFSLVPWRLVELFWPNVFGTVFRGYNAWMGGFAPPRLMAEVWIPSLYVGGLTLLLALGAIGFRDGPPWRGWLSAIVIVSLLGSLGDYTGPLFWARWIPGCAEWLGPHDPHDTTTVRLDGYLRDGDGSIYWFLATLLPGFRQFRFPSKLLTFTALGLAALAGLGWDRLVASWSTAGGRDRKLARLSTVLLAVSLAALAVAVVAHRPFVARLRPEASGGLRSGFGPIDPGGAYRELVGALVQASAVAGFGLALARRGARRPGLAGVLTLVATTADLTLANAQHVLTVPQQLFETTPRLVKLIEEARSKDPFPGPFRVHRMPLWEPLIWLYEPSTNRVEEFVAWERETIQPKYGINYGIHYTLALGVAELYDYEWFFGGFYRTVNGEAARMLKLKPGERIVLYPRRSFDLWNTRYFILPVFPKGWTDEHRSYAVFLPHSETVYPDPNTLQDPANEKQRKHWLEREDFQVLRNLNAFPRAWAVHDARFLRPISGLERSDRDAPMLELLYPDDVFWHDPDQVYYDAHTLAWIEVDEAKKSALHEYLPKTRPGGGESVTITSYGPQRVELDAVLEQPGLVILADIYYPGWRLTIDGESAPIYRANRMMRGAAVKPGRHHLVYTYEPLSFTVGAWVTAVAFAVCAGLVMLFARRPVSDGLVPDGLA